MFWQLRARAWGPIIHKNIFSALLALFLNLDFLFVLKCKLSVKSCDKRKDKGWVETRKKEKAFIISSLYLQVKWYSWENTGQSGWYNWYEDTYCRCTGISGSHNNTCCILERKKILLDQIGQKTMNISRIRKLYWPWRKLLVYTILYRIYKWQSQIMHYTKFKGYEILCGEEESCWPCSNPTHESLLIFSQSNISD